jgi:hypothetical protein
LIGFLRGTVLVAQGTDLTEPTDPYWGLDLPSFKSSLANREPPPNLTGPLAALW